MFKFLLLIFSFSALAQSPKIISIKDYNPQAKYTLPICIVDSSGEMECKYPPKKEEEKKPEVKKNKKQKKYIVPAAHIGHEMGLSGTTLGTYKGIGLNYFYRDHHLSFGGKIAGTQYSPPIGEDSSSSGSLDIITQAQMSYHVFPRWYNKMLKNSSFDPSIGLSLGYLYLGQETAERESSPFVGLSLKVARPVFNSFNAYIEIETLQNFSNKNKANLGSVGLSMDF